MALEKHRENYRVLEASSPGGLEFKVHAATHNGDWRLAGGVSCILMPSGVMFYQAITNAVVPLALQIVE